MDAPASSSKASNKVETPSTSSMGIDSAPPNLPNTSSSKTVASGGSKTVSCASQNDDKTRKLYLIVYKFLQQQMTENQNLNATQKESLEVIVHCLGYAFQFFEFDYVEHSLPKIYDFFEKHKHDFKKKHVSYCFISFNTPMVRI